MAFLISEGSKDLILYLDSTRALNSGFHQTSIALADTHRKNCTSASERMIKYGAVKSVLLKPVEPFFREEIFLTGHILTDIERLLLLAKLGT
jgi:hypothetical protein